MPVTGNYLEAMDRVKHRLQFFLDGMKEDLELAGKAAAEGIVSSTLAGIGEGDQPFAPYSPKYQELIDSVGGKPQQTVNLRGLFYHEGQQPKKYRSEKSRLREREGRRAIIGIAFAAGGKDGTMKGLRIFQARTQVTRPARGVTDKNSEMSLDLIKVQATNTSLRLTYDPRNQAYMVWHNDGTGKSPRRPWFTLQTQKAWHGLMSIINLAIRSRVDAVNKAPVADTGPVHPRSWDASAGGFWVD